MAISYGQKSGYIHPTITHNDLSQGIRSIILELTGREALLSGGGPTFFFGGRQNQKSRAQGKCGYIMREQGVS